MALCREMNLSAGYCRKIGFINELCIAETALWAWQWRIIAQIYIHDQPTLIFQCIVSRSSTGGKSLSWCSRILRPWLRLYILQIKVLQKNQFQLALSRASQTSTIFGRGKILASILPNTSKISST
jgi:hypothetical protein